MPLNLAALVRYRTINNCLSSIKKFTISQLVERCSDAITEYKGMPSSVSERTVREDIKNMRSDVLGLNAPIVQKNGYYYYSDRSYDLINVFIKEQNLAFEILDLLFELGGQVKHPKIDEMISKLERLTGLESKSGEMRCESSSNIKFSLNQNRRIKIPDEIFEPSESFMIEEEDLFENSMESFPNMPTVETKEKKSMLQSLRLRFYDLLSRIRSMFSTKKPEMHQEKITKDKPGFKYQKMQEKRWETRMGKENEVSMKDVFEVLDYKPEFEF